MKELIKQPNGKYCKMDWGRSLKFYNYTEEDIINMYIEKAKKDMEDAEHYGEIIKNIEKNSDKKDRVIHDGVLVEMGFNKPYEELVKFIPRNPLHKSYSGHDCTTYAKCPSCGTIVQNGMGGTDTQCGKCGQLLEWSRY